MTILRHQNFSWFIKNGLAFRYYLSAQIDPAVDNVDCTFADFLAVDVEDDSVPIVKINKNRFKQVLKICYIVLVKVCYKVG